MFYIQNGRKKGGKGVESVRVKRLGGEKKVPNKGQGKDKKILEDSNNIRGGGLWGGKGG